jgi:hypothetical protein
VPVHRANVGKPNSVALGFAAKCFLDGRIDEYSFDLWLLRGRANDEQMTWCNIKTFGSMSRRSGRTIIVADISSRSTRDNFSIWHRRELNIL